MKIYLINYVLLAERIIQIRYIDDLYNLVLLNFIVKIYFNFCITYRMKQLYFILYSKKYNL